MTDGTSGEKNLENKSGTGTDKEMKKSLTAPWQRLRMKVGIMSLDRQTADIYWGAEMVIYERGRSKAAPVFPTELVYTRFAEYADEISHLGRLCCSVGQMVVGAGGKRLIFNRRAELCHDVLMHPNRLLEFIPPQSMNEFNNDSLHINQTTFASHIIKRFSVAFSET